MDEKEAKKRLMLSSKGELAKRLLFAYKTIQNLEAKLEGAKNTEQPLQPENGPIKCANNGCAGWDEGYCAVPGLCRGGAVSG